MSKIPLLFVAPGPVDTWSSSRLRALWPSRYIPGAQVVNIEDGEIPEAEVYVWVKRVIQEVLEERGGFHIWDVCDPVWWFEPEDAAEVYYRVDEVVTSNEALAKDFLKEFGDAPFVIPDRLELEHYEERAVHQEKRVLDFVWFGASQNRVSLFAAIPTLERLRANGVEFVLNIYDDQPNARWQLSDKFETKNFRWSLQGENKFLAGQDIAILPPYPGAWGEVKSNNKKLTAWASGLAVSEGVDFSELFALATNTGERWKNAGRGLGLVRQRYDVKQSAAEWQWLISKLKQEAPTGEEEWHSF